MTGRDRHFATALSVLKGAVEDPAEGSGKAYTPVILEALRERVEQGIESRCRGPRGWLGHAITLSLIAETYGPVLFGRLASVVDGGVVVTSGDPRHTLGHPNFVPWASLRIMALLPDTPDREPTGLLIESSR